jgi:hypothetical protein
MFHSTAKLIALCSRYFALLNFLIYGMINYMDICGQNAKKAHNGVIAQIIYSFLSCCSFVMLFDIVLVQYF